MRGQVLTKRAGSPGKGHLAHPRGDQAAPEQGEMNGSWVKKTGWPGREESGNEKKNTFRKVQNSQGGREASTHSVKEQGAFWKLDKEFEESAER